MRIIWAPQALRDLREIYLYLMKDSPGAARALHERIRSRVLQLADAPQIGRPGRVPGTRELVIPRSRYIVPYRLAGDTLQVLRVYHTARVWPGAFD